ncbi:polymorphic toxin type 44 domain-containing protein [Pseudomonas sp. Z2-11]
MKKVTDFLTAPLMLGSRPFKKLQKEHAMRVPSSPPGVSVEENMAVAHHKKNVLKAGSAFIYSWFYTQVRNRGPWDYKKLSAEYEAFGNFNYGATGTAAGFSEDVLLRAAGLAQSRAGTTTAEFGTWWGQAPFGDDPGDQRWIKEGVKYAKFRNY